MYVLIKKNSEHPTVQWNYDMLKKEFPTISMGKVYRNINILWENIIIIVFYHQPEEFKPVDFLPYITGGKYE